MFSFWRISLDRPGTLLSKEKKPSASMLGSGFVRVTGIGVTTVGGVTTIGVTDGCFLRLLCRKRGAMAYSMVPGNYMKNILSWICQVGHNIFSGVWPLTSQSSLSDPNYQEDLFSVYGLLITMGSCKKWRENYVKILICMCYIWSSIYKYICK